MSAAVERPTGPEEAARVLRELGREGRSVRVRGGATKLLPLSPTPPPVELATGAMTRIVEHNAGDFTLSAQAGLRVADLQSELAAAGQMLALDPPLGDAGGEAAATLGGIIAAGDSGPLRHRYGSMRDLVLGITVALSDGTVARAGGKVIKNVAGYDLAKLFTGSWGTLGLIAEVSLRLHPRPEASATAVGRTGAPAALAAAAIALTARPLEAECLDVAWSEGAGEVLVRFGGRSAATRAAQACELMRGLEDVRAVEDDEDIWERQRARQHGPGTVVRLAGVIDDLPRVLATAQALDASVVSRAAGGISWLRGDGVTPAELRERLPGMTLSHAGGRTEPPPPAGAARVMDRLKERFDPAGIFPRGAWS